MVYAELIASVWEAVDAGDTAKLEELLSDPRKIVNTHGGGLLRSACSRCYPSILHRLLDAGADPELKDDKGYTCLMYMIMLIDGNRNAETHHQYMNIVRLLLEHGADVNARDMDDATPLYMVCSMDEKYGGEIVELTKLFLEKGADVNTKNYTEETPLMQAAFKHNLMVVRLLLDHGADVNMKDEDGWTALHDACKGGHADIAQLLIAAGLDVNARDNQDRTPLHMACDRSSSAGCGRVETVQVLLRAGAIPNVSDDECATPLDLVMDMPPGGTREEILDLFRELRPEAVMEAYCSRQGPGGMS